MHQELTPRPLRAVALAVGSGQVVEGSDPSLRPFLSNAARGGRVAYP